MRLALLLLLIVPQTVLANERQEPAAGFICASSTGDVRRINIDLKRKTYDDGRGTRKLGEVNDIEIVIERSNPDLLSTPFGPIISDLKLDRRTLVLTDLTAIPERNIRRETSYQCTMGPLIDFTTNRQF